MAPALLLSLQAAAPAAPPPREVAPIEFDIASLRARSRCAPGAGSEIVVCGNRGGGGYRIEETARRHEPRPPVAQFGLGGGATGRIYVESAPLDRGAVSNRVMFGIRLPF